MNRDVCNNKINGQWMGRLLFPASKVLCLWLIRGQVCSNIRLIKFFNFIIAKISIL